MARKLEIECDDGETRVLKLVNQAHREKGTIQSVRIEYWGEEGGILLSLNQYSTIFGKIGNLPNVKEVSLHFTHSAPPLPVQALQKLIYCHAEDELEGEDQFEDYSDSVSVAARRLEYISLHHVKLAGTPEEFESLKDSIESNRSILEVHLQGCSSVASLQLPTDTPPDTTAPIHHGMSVCLQALANLPSLNKLHIDGVCHLSCDGVTSLCQSQYLKVLELWNMPDDLNEYGPVMADALQRGKLEELEISSNLQSTAGNAMANMLESNTRLKTLGFDIDYVEYGQSLARVLQSGCNQTLQNLHLRVVGGAPIVIAEDPDETEEELNKYTARILSEAQTILKALEQNTVLENLHINFYTIPPKKVENELIEDLEQLLLENFVLKNLTLRGNHSFSELGPKVGMLLRLNRAGRGDLLLGEQGVPRSRWVEAILAHQADTDIVFYFLSTNPSLCSFSGSDAG